MLGDTYAPGSRESWPCATRGIARGRCVSGTSGAAVSSAMVPAEFILFEGIDNFEEVELPVVPIQRVEPAHTVLQEEGRQVSVRDEVAADGEAGGHPTVGVKKCLPLREHAHARQAEEGLDVAEGIVGRERSGEYPRMGGDTEIGNQRGAGEAEQVRVRGALPQEADGLRMLGAGRIRSVEEDIDVDRIAQSSLRSRMLYTASLSERATSACMGRDAHWSLGSSGALFRRARPSARSCETILPRERPSFSRSFLSSFRRGASKSRVVRAMMY